MNRALVLVVALYAIWRVAVVMGRRRERALAASFPSVGRQAVERCARCGRIAPRIELTATGRWPIRAWLCAGECSPDGPAERAGALR